MTSTTTAATGSDSPEKSGRLREILAILAKSGIAGGLSPQKLRSAVEELGPTFVKLGQILSMRRDLLPEAYCAELAKLRADVRPLSLEEVRGVAEEEYARPLEEVFSSFSPEPLGSASIAQVHAAVLPDGRRVVVKVQRPGVRETMARDIPLLHRAADFMKLTELGGVVDLHMVLDEMWAVAQQELDFLLEAKNADEFREKNAGVAYVSCPEIVHALTTGRVLVMEYVDGVPIDDPQALAAQEYRPAEVGAKLADNYVKQVVDDGFFHADPHPGNLRLRDGKIVFLDLGMMGRLSPRDQALLRQAVRCCAGRDVEGLKNVVLSLGVPGARVDQEKLYRDVDALLARYGSMQLGRMNVGKLFEEVLGVAHEHRISMPPGLSMLARGMMTLEGVLSALSPDIDLLQILARRMYADALHDFDLRRELLDGARTLYTSAGKAAEVPAELSDLLRMGLRGQARLNLNLTDSDRPLAALDGMVNRALLCLLACALLVSGAILCLAGAGPLLWGLPAAAILCFAAALALAARLFWSMRRRKK